MIQSISIRQILDDCLNHPLMKELSLERAVNYAVEFIRIIGMPQVFTEKNMEISIKGYRAMLPCDFVEMKQVYHKDKSICLYSTDNFHYTQDGCESDNTYKLQGNFIYTSFKEGTIIVSYNSIEVDKDGFPLIPDNSSFIRALEAYVKKEYFTILFDESKINGQILAKAEERYAWAVGQAQSDMVKLSQDQWQNVSNIMNSLLIRTSDSENGYKYLGRKNI